MIKNAIASLAVSDVLKAAEWYERLFGRPADTAPMKELVEWKFEDGEVKSVSGYWRVGGRGIMMRENLPQC